MYPVLPFTERAVVDLLTREWRITYPVDGIGHVHEQVRQPRQ